MIRPSRRALLVSLLMTAHCRRETHVDAPPPIDAADARPPLAAASMAPALLDAAPLAPAALTCGSAASVDVLVVKNVTDVSGLAVAATRERAHVTFAVSGDHGCEHDGCYAYGEAGQVVFDASGTASPITSPKAAAVGIAPSVDAVPFVMGGALHVFTQGHAGAAPMAEPGQDPADTIYVLRDGAILTRSTKWFTGFFAAAGAGDSAVVLGVGQEWSWARTGLDDAPRSVRVFRVARDGAIKGELVTKGAPNDQSSTAGERFYSPAIAADPERAAFAYRHTKGKAAPHLFVGWVDRRTGKAVAPPVDVASGDVGAPALALDGTTLHVVWAARESDKAPYTLVHATWTSGKDAPSAPAILATPTPTALSPSVAKVGGGLALAWMDAKDTRHGAIWAGHGATLEAAAEHAAPRSAATVVNARDPRWGAFGEGAALAWTEHDGPRRVRLAWCSAR